MIQKTEQARNEASSEHADQFAADDWIAAETSWQEASAKLDAKSYGDAYTLLLKAKTRYDKAHSLAKGRRETAIKDITAQQQTARIRLKELTDNPDLKKLSPARKKEFDQIAQQLGINIENVSTQLQNAQYNDAKLLVGKTQRDIWETKQEYLKK
jgi:hypothetical protein